MTRSPRGIPRGPNKCCWCAAHAATTTKRPRPRVGTSPLKSSAVSTAATALRSTAACRKVGLLKSWRNRILVFVLHPKVETPSGGTSRPSRGVAPNKNLRVLESSEIFDFWEHRDPSSLAPNGFAVADPATLLLWHRTQACSTPGTQDYLSSRQAFRRC
jgi:hypothetical protein